ncbi:Rdx family-domain-containing protein [Trametes elegans]|nr:Rdx family-domain-containing protein [Trametes elegans]
MAGPASCVDCQPDAQQESSNTVTSQPDSTTVQNPLDPTTFIPPSTSITPSVTIEFCDRCRWLHRATWVSTELFLTFPTPALKSITVLPLNSEDTAGRFRVWLFLDGKPPILVWDRKVEGSFPELKVLKQRIRDHIQPGKSLGHSDK